MNAKSNGPSDNQDKNRRDKPSLDGETIEARILLSATWVSGDVVDNPEETVLPSAMDADAASNYAPDAEAGADQTVSEGDSVKLSGADSYDKDRSDTLSYSWTQTSGPTVTLTGARTITPTFTAPEGVANTTLTFELTVSDGKQSATDTVTVNVNADDDAPTADAGASRPVDEGDRVTLDATGSTDPEGQSLTYSWTQISGPSVTLSDANVAQPTFIAPEGLVNTNIQFELTVNDGTNASVDTVTIQVNADNDAPTASAGSDQTVDEGDDVTLVGTGSSDPEGQGLTYTWTQISGPTVTLSDASAVSPTFTAPEGLANTTVQFELTVSDGSNTSSADTVSITVNADNDAPTAGAGSDQTVDEGDVVTLDGASSSDPEGQGLTYTWTQISGPTVTLSDASAVSPTFTAPDGLTNTAVQFELTVSDGTNTSSADTVSITINADNDAPTSNAGSDQTVDEGDVVTLTGAASSDPEGQGLTYTWMQVSGPTVSLSDANAAAPTFTAPEQLSNTTIQFELTVSDGTNTSSADTVSITVNADNDAPTSNAGGDQIVDEGDVVTLDGRASSDPEGQGLTYTWTQISGPTVTLSDANASQPTFAAPEGLTNTSVQFQLQVSDGTNTSSADTVSITINADNDAPTAGAGSDQTVDEGDLVTLDGRSSSDPEGQGLTYTWTQISGPSVTLENDSTAQPSFTAPEGLTNATVLFQLQVSDGTNTSSADTVSITVNADNDGPTTEAGANQQVSSGTFVTLDATGSSDPEGQSLTYSWTQIAGPSVSLTDDSSAQPQFIAPAPSIDPVTLTFEVSANDGTNTTTDTVEVTVRPSSMIGQWTFEGSGQIVTDDSGRGNDGNLGWLAGDAQADPTRVVDAERGNVLSFDGTQLVDDIGQGPSGDFTLSGWVNHAGTGSGWDVIYAGGDQAWIAVEADTGKVALGIGGNGDWVETAPGQVTADNWQHIAGTWNGTTGKIFVDGAEVAVVTVGSPSNPTAADASIGAIHSGSIASNMWQGKLDDVRAYDIALSAADILTMADNDPPVADAGTTQIVNEGDVVTLDGSSSSDPEGQTLTYTWTQVSGPSVTLSDANASQPTFQAPEGIANTTVQFELVVNDGVSNSTADTVAITINADNDAPTAGAGTDQTVDEGDVVTLDGSSSSDAEGTGLTYTWTQISGPSVTLSDASAAQPTFTAPDGLSNSTVQFQLQVSDGVNTSSVDTVSITVNADNDAPTAAAGGNQTVNEGDVVTLDGSGSSDPEGQALTYTWVQTKGPTITLSDASAAQPTFTAPDGVSNTTVQFELQVSDGTNTSSADTVTITINADNDAPTANAGIDQTVDEGDTVTLNGTSSNDPEGQGLKYTWTQISGPTVTLSDASAAQPKFAAPEGLSNTTVQFQLQVSDGTSTSSTDTVTITVNADNDAPNASAGVDQTAAEGDVVTLNGSNSSDPEGQGLTYTWTQISGPTVTLSSASAMQPTFTAPEGLSNTTVQFELTVGDGTNTSSADTVSITVNADNDAPTAGAGSDQTVDEGDVVTLDGTASSDPEGQGLTYTWTQISGPTVTLSDATASQPTFAAPEGLSNSTVQFELTVSDGTNTSSADTVSITINADNDAPTSNAGSDQTVDEGDVVTLNGSSSSDPEGQGLTYTWTQVSGPTVTLSDATAAQPTFTAPQGLSNTSVRFQLQVSDGVNTSSVDTVDITVNADNDAPTASAGEDRMVTEGADVTLDGTRSSDPEGQTLTYTWTQISGPTVTLDDASAASPTFTAPEGVTNTTVQFQLQVSDGTNTSSADTVSIQVNAIDDAPRADAGTQQAVSEGDVVTLNGGGSSDAEGQSLTYQWRQVSGPAVVLNDPTSPTPSFSAPDDVSNTSIVFELQVSDGSNVSSIDTVSIGIGADNDAPTADAGSGRIVEEGTVVTLDGSGSSDPEGQELTYRWVQISGPRVELDDASAAQPSFTAPERLANTAIGFRLTVSDGTNFSQDTVTVGVRADNDAPSVDAGQNRIVLHNSDVQLNATATDPENQGLTYTWQQIGGPDVVLNQSDTANPTFEAPNVSDGTVLTFVVGVDDGDNKAFDTVRVAVAPNQGPSVSISGMTEVDSGGAATINAIAVDREGDSLSYRWTQMGGPNVVLAGEQQALLNFQAPDVDSSTTLTFQVEVTDGNKVTAQTVQVQVSAPEVSDDQAKAIPKVDSTTPTAVEASDNKTAVETQSDEPVDAPTQREQVEQDEVVDNPVDDLVTVDPTATLEPSSSISSLMDTNPSYESPTGSESSELTLASARLTTDSSADTGATELESSSKVESSRSSTLDSETGGDSSEFMMSELFADSSTAASGNAEVRITPDLVVADAGDQLELKPRAIEGLEDTAIEDVEQVRWSQTAGTPVEIATETDGVLQLTLPTVFVEEEVVFEVELVRGGERIVQEVAVQVQPVAMTSRSLAIDEHLDPQNNEVQEEDEGGSRGFGKIWGALLAFFGASAGRRKE